MRTDAATPSTTQVLRPSERGPRGADTCATRPARRRVHVAGAAPAADSYGWRPREARPVPSELRAWEALTSYERGLPTGRDVEPYLTAFRVGRRHDHQAHCGHCGHVVATVYEVEVAKGTSFVCSDCIDEGRRGRRMDAMVFAVGRTRPSHRR